MLIRRAALDEVGLFDEGYWMYMEDLDLCYRFAEAGWVTWYEPSATVIHVKAGTSGPVRSPQARTTPSTTGCSASTASTTRRREAGS